MSTMQTTRHAEDLLTPADVAAHLGVSAGTVRGWTRSPSLAGHIRRDGRRIYLRPEVIDELRHYSGPIAAPASARYVPAQPRWSSVLALLQDHGSLPTTDIAKYLTFPQSRALAALEELEAEGLVDRAGSPPSWALTSPRCSGQSQPAANTSAR